MLTLGVISDNQFQFVYLYGAFYNTAVSRCFGESETQSQNPRLSTAAGKTPFNRPRKGREGERGRTERVKRERTERQRSGNKHLSV